MNREQTKCAIEVMQAYVDGEQIQVKLPTGWIDEFNPSWHLHCQYRVKPEPITCWVTVLNNRKASTVHMTEEDANNCVHPERNPGWTVRKVVIE